MSKARYRIVYHNSDYYIEKRWLYWWIRMTYDTPHGRSYYRFDTFDLAEQALNTYRKHGTFKVPPLVVKEYT